MAFPLVQLSAGQCENPLDVSDEPFEIDRLLQKPLGASHIFIGGEVVKRGHSGDDNDRNVPRIAIVAMVRIRLTFFMIIGLWEL
jgi:hypothetical protein